jgi:transposase
MAEFFQQLPDCRVGMEATRSAHYWARVLSRFGHEVRLIAPKFVKPYLKSQKNDANAEAIGRPSMRFVPAKTIEQQDMQALHRVRAELTPYSQPETVTNSQTARSVGWHRT